MNEEDLRIIDSITVVSPRTNRKYLASKLGNVATAFEIDNTSWHDHKKNAKISGVFYISVPKNSGNIMFRKKIKIRMKNGL